MLPGGPRRPAGRGRAPRLVWLLGVQHLPQVVYVESWIFAALFGVNGEMLAAFQRTCIVLLSIELDPLGGVLIFIYGRPFLQTLAMLLIVSASLQLRIRRNRARAWAKGLQGSVWASRRFI